MPGHHQAPSCSASSGAGDDVLSGLLSHLTLAVACELPLQLASRPALRLVVRLALQLAGSQISRPIHGYYCCYPLDYCVLDYPQVVLS
jgi:hypothetical protein